MKDSPIQSAPNTHHKTPVEMFSTPPASASGRGLWFSMGCITALIVALTFFYILAERRSAPKAALNVEAPTDPYASRLEFSRLAMSQSTSLSGGTSTFIDGFVRNTGPDTLKSITVQVAFRNDAGLSPQIETLPLALIRTHEPYVDTEPLNSAPLKPGGVAEFRLIFERIPANWNQAPPVVRVVKVAH